MLRIMKMVENCNVISFLMQKMTKQLRFVSRFISCQRQRKCRKDRCYRSICCYRSFRSMNYNLSIGYPLAYSAGTLGDTCRAPDLAFEDYDRLPYMLHADVTP